MHDFAGQHHRAASTRRPRMGRLNLHMILSFAQYERELAGERIRDKFLPSRRRGHVDGRPRAARLRRAGPEARRQRGRGGARPAHLRALPAGRLGHQAGAGAERRRAPHQARQAVRQGRRLQAAQQPRPMSARSSTRARPTRAQHEAIVDRDTWDKVHAILAENRRRRRQPHARGDALRCSRA